MAKLLRDGSIQMRDGRILWGRDQLQIIDLIELQELLMPARAGAGFISGGGGGRGAQGKPGPAGPAGPPGPPGPALSARLDNAIYVAKNGNDATGDGSLDKPFLTIAAAIAYVTGASITNRYGIIVAPGRYNETVPILLKPWVFLLGSSFIATRIAAPSWGLDPSFAVGDTRSGIENATISSASGSIIFDFNALASIEGKLYFDVVWFNNPVTITSFHPVNQYIVRDCFTFGSFTVNGSQFYPINCTFQFPVVVNNGPANNNIVFIDNHSDYEAGLTLNFPGGLAGGFVALYGSAIDDPGLSATGPFALNATSDALPIKSKLVLAGGAVLNRLNDAFGEGYAPAVPAQWAPPAPTNVDAALNRLAAAVFGLVGPIP